MSRDKSGGETPLTGVAGWLAAAATLLVLDLLWLGFLARPLYQAAIGHLLRAETNRPAAMLFYLFYVTLVWGWAVKEQTPKRALARGAGLGFAGYGIYELTNWAVLRDWPAWIVPVDWLWGIVLTGAAAWVGASASERAR